MKKSVVFLLTSFISGVFIVSLFYFGINLYHENKNGQKSVEMKFEELCKLIEKNPEQTTLNSEKINFEDFNYISISKNDKMYFVFPDLSSDENVNDNSNFSKVFVKKIYQGKNKYSVSAKIYTLPPYEVFYYGKNSFIIILIATLITMILALTIKNTQSTAKEIQSETNENSEPETTTNDENETSNSNNFDFSEIQNNEIELEQENLNESAENNEEIIEENIQEINTENDTTSEKEDSISFDNDNSLSYKTEILPYKENTITFLKDKTNIYSENTGFVKNEYLISSLDGELEKCGSCELDLSLILINIQGLFFTDSCIEKIKSTLLTKFEFKEQIFEYNYEGFAIICPNVSINDAEKFSDEVKKSLLNDVKDSGLTEISIGISSRAERVVSADRIISEAEKALEKAKTDSSIVAFHIDIKKYRDFLNNN